MRIPFRQGLGIPLSCLAAGALPSVIELIFRPMGLAHFSASVLQGFVYSSCIGIPCWTVAPRLLSALAERSPLARAAAVTALFLVFGVAGCLAANLILAAVGLVSREAFARVFWWSLRVSLVMTFTFGVLTVIINMLQNRLLAAKKELQERRIAEERERKIAAEARFASLESRVRPHFLFNTLNSISALVREDPAQAERTIERLSALLRFSLDSELAGLVSLNEEIRIVRDYLEIERVRFGARLRYRIEMGEEAGARQVPALSIQTLAENSVKYAVGARREGAEIVVSADVEQGTLRVSVQDDGPGFDAAGGLKPGHGLDLLQRRLAALFGPAASLDMTAESGRMNVAIRIAAS